MFLCQVSFFSAFSSCMAERSLLFFSLLEVGNLVLGTLHFLELSCQDLNCTRGALIVMLEMNQKEKDWQYHL